MFYIFFCLCNFSWYMVFVFGLGFVHYYKGIHFESQKNLSIVFMLQLILFYFEQSKNKLKQLTLLPSTIKNNLQKLQVIKK